MIGKANEISIAEVELSSVNKWLYENPNKTILDIKYSFHPDGKAWALIIYKEVTS